MSQILMLVVPGILLLIGKASPYYKKPYDGYTFILPDAVKDHSNIKPMQLSFSKAQQWCTNDVPGSTLATIPDKVVQQNIARFIESALKDNKQLIIDPYSNIRLNGKYHITDEWRWVNGHSNAVTTVRKDPEKSMYPFYARLDANFIIYSAKSDIPRYFICENPGKSEICDLFYNEKCYHKKENRSFTWYEARNHCLDGGGDLSSFETLNDTNIGVSLSNLSLNSKWQYWIGLQKNEWRWQDTGFPIKYTNWENYGPSNYSGQCLCLIQSNWTWNGCDCFEPYPFICLLKETNKFVITTISVSCAAVFVVVIIIAAALITKKRRNSNAPHAEKSSGYGNPECTNTESSKDFPVYAEIQKPKEINSASNTTYASVQMAAKSNEAFPGSNIVYAELDLASRA